MSCVFCDIVDDKAPATVVARWSDAVAFVPLNPVVDGHVLIVPTTHVDHFAEFPLASALAMLRAAEFARRYDSFNIITSTGRAATQSIDHLHIHVVPRSPSDRLMTPWGTIYGDEPSAPHWCRVADELAGAMVVTQQYARLPARPGWTWFDTLSKYRPDVIERLARSNEPEEKLP